MVVNRIIDINFIWNNIVIAIANNNFSCFFRDG